MSNVTLQRKMETEREKVQPFYESFADTLVAGGVGVDGDELDATVVCNAAIR
jgi:hypothetical protein